MQVNRLFEIVYILLNKKQVTAKELSDRFEVSTRTIYRDIENLSGAGIPIYTNQGKGGGISLMENFVLSKAYLSEKEQSEILIALQGLKATPYISENEALSKLSALFGRQEIDWITVDFSGWDKVEKQKFECIKAAIIGRTKIQFDYYNVKMEKLNRIVEPLQLCFKEKTWYLVGYCMIRKEMRLFKLKRIKALISLEEKFEIDKRHQFNRQKSDEYPYLLEHIKLWVEDSQAYRVFDEFSETQITRQEDGHFVIEMDYPIDEWVYGYILSFGPYAKVLEPEKVKVEIQCRLKNAIQRYEVK